MIIWAQVQVEHLSIEQAILHLCELGAGLVHAAVARCPCVRCQRVLHLLHRVDDGLDKVCATHLYHIVARWRPPAMAHPGVFGRLPLVLGSLTGETLDCVSWPSEKKSSLRQL